MARTKASRSLRALDGHLTRRLLHSKPPVRLPEVGHSTTCCGTPTHLLPGKAPRKQLATKAARKTAAAVRVETLCLAVR